VSADVDPRDLIGAARDLIRIQDARTAGLWPRAAALLARQAIELTMARLWGWAAPGMERMPWRCQLLCLGPLLGDRELAGHVSTTWSSLTRACHHRIYELPPTAAELNSWLECAWDLSATVERSRPARLAP